MNKEELIQLIKLEYGKAEDYFGLAASCDFHDIGYDHEVQFNYKWTPYFFKTRIASPIFLLTEDILTIKMKVWASVIIEYNDKEEYSKEE